MNLPAASNDNKPAEPESQPRKGFWTTILSITPVLMTVLATILAGLSSSEMTQAQYHRALAAQNQSKAGDQWNFFQAKRIRQISLQTTIDLLQNLSDPGKIDDRWLEDAVEQLNEELKRAEKEVAQLIRSLTEAKGESGGAKKRALNSAERLQKIIRGRSGAGAGPFGNVLATKGTADAQEAFKLANSNKLPPAEIRAIDNPEISIALKGIEDRRGETELAPLINSIDEETLRRAIEQAEANILALERANKPVSDSLGALDRTVQEQAQITRDLHRGMRRINAALAATTEANGKELKEIRNASTALSQTIERMKTLMDEIGADFKTLRHGYTIRRYDEEAKHNQLAASIYEIQVRKSSVSSERHRDKSRSFFYGMLAAQAAVTIASFALAVKYKSLLWSMATVAGIGALAFGGWVYLH